MTGRTVTSRAAADGDQDFAGRWLDAMLSLTAADVDEHDPSAVRRWVTAEALDTLRREADRYDFKPWVISGCTPTGEGFTRWRSEFLARYDGRRG